MVINWFLRPYSATFLVKIPLSALSPTKHAVLKAYVKTFQAQAFTRTPICLLVTVLFSHLPKDKYHRKHAKFFIDLVNVEQSFICSFTRSLHLICFGSAIFRWYARKWTLTKFSLYFTFVIKMILVVVSCCLSPKTQLKSESCGTMSRYYAWDVWDSYRNYRSFGYCQVSFSC